MNKEYLHELALNLDGVIADVELGTGFDAVCLNTVKWVRGELQKMSEGRAPTRSEGVCAMCGALKEDQIVKPIHLVMCGQCGGEKVGEIEDDTACPTCGEDGGTSCGEPNCGLLKGTE